MQKQKFWPKKLQLNFIRCLLMFFKTNLDFENILQNWLEYKISIEYYKKCSLKVLLEKWEFIRQSGLTIPLENMI